MKAVISTIVLICALSISAIAQKTVTGKILDSSGLPLPGASITEKGSTAGTSSNQDGIYQIKVSSDKSILVFKSIGFITEEAAVGAKSQINITLKSDSFQLEGVTIVGSRSPNRSATQTPVPVDVISMSKVTNTVGQLDVNQLLQFVAPSFNSNRQTGSDGADHVDPASLRGLGPDQTLVLINGKRRHQSSLVNLFGTRGRGNTGTDLNTIPTAAIDRIEILRDGAAAQYGSDAIAGVINIVLKKTVNEFSVNLNSGVTSEKDGENYGINGNYGFKAGKKGFVNLTTDYLYRGRTNRAEDPNLYEDPESDVPRRFYGDALMKSFSTMYNAQFDLSEKVQLYSFAGFSNRNGDAYAFTRYPDNERNIKSIYPNGFDPQIISDIKDRSISAGIKTTWNNWKIDLNNTFGYNKFNYTVDHTLNRSIGPTSPTKFDAGGFQLSQNVIGIDFNRFFDKTLAAGTNLALGAEFRSENYKIFAGEEGSWKAYSEAPAGSQGFPGFQPDNATNASRTNFGAFADAEFNFSKQFLLGAAVRFEHYNDFGNTTNGKLTGRYQFSPAFTLRGSASTGFRAPSLAQAYFNTTYTNVVGGVPVEIQLAKNNSAIAQTLGIEALKQERTVNATLGFTSRLASQISFTLDGYYVKIKDRIVLTGSFTEKNSPEIAADLQRFHIGEVKFFTNALDTETWGLDAVFTYATTFGYNQSFSSSLAANFNKLKPGNIKTSPKLAGKSDIYFDDREKAFLVASAPNSKVNLTFDYRYSKFNTNLRFVRFDKLQLLDYNYAAYDKYAARITTDLTFGYAFTKKVSLSIGASNLFNVHPSTSDAVNSESGGIYEPVQMGFNGTYYFTKLAFKF